MTKLQILEKALEDAQAIYIAAEGEVAKTDSELKAAKTALTTAEGNLSTAMTALKQAEASPGYSPPANNPNDVFHKAVIDAKEGVDKADGEVVTAKTTVEDAQKALDDAEVARNDAKKAVIAAEKDVADEKLALSLLAPTPPVPPAQPVNVHQNVTNPPAPPPNEGGDRSVNVTVEGGNWNGFIAGLAVTALILLAVMAVGMRYWSQGNSAPVQVTAVTAPAPAPVVATTVPTPPGAPVDPSTLALLGGPDWTTCNEGESWCLHYGADRWGFFLRNTEVKPVCWESGSSAINSAPVPCIVDKTTGNAVTAACLPSDPTESRPATTTCPEVVATNHRLNG